MRESSFIAFVGIMLIMVIILMVIIKTRKVKKQKGKPKVPISHSLEVFVLLYTFDSLVHNTIA